MKTFLLLAILGTTGPLVACASSDKADTGSGIELPERFTVAFRADLPMHRTEVNAPIERVSALIPGVYQFLGLPVAAATGEEHVFITPNLRIKGRLYEGEANSDYLDCGESGPGGVRADLYEVRFSVLTRLYSGADGGTIVETLVNGRAIPPGAGRGIVRCTGTGKLEGMIADLLRRRASGSR